MKVSVKGMMMTLAMVLTIVFAYAQPRGGGQRGGDPAEQAKKQTERLTSELELNAKQTKKVEAINMKYAKQMQQMRAEMREQREAGEEMDREAMGAKMKEMRATHEDEIKSVLTPAQIQKFDAMPKAERGGKGKAKKAKKGGKEGKAKGKKGKKAKKGKDMTERVKKQTERMTAELELNAKQTAKVEAINMKYAKQTQENRATYEGKENVDKKAINKKRKEMRVAHEKEIKTVLTPAQIEKFDALKAEREAKGKAKKQKQGKKGKKPAKEEMEEEH